MSNDNYRSMIVKLHGEIEDEDLPKLKVALYDIINNAAAMQKATALDLFSLLESGANITNTNVDLLFELFEVTGLEGLHQLLLQYNYERIGNENMISDYRRMLIEVGNALETEDVAALAKLSDIKKRDSKNNWDLINSLTRQMKVADNIEIMTKFGTYLNDQKDLKKVQTIVVSFIQKKQAICTL